VQSVPITTNVVSSNPAHGEVYSIHHYVFKFVSYLRQVGGFHRVLQFPSPLKLTNLERYSGVSSLIADTFPIQACECMFPGSEKVSWVKGHTILILFYFYGCRFYSLWCIRNIKLFSTEVAGLSL
jgi:hypothetical protein